MCVGGREGKRTRTGVRELWDNLGLLCVGMRCAACAWLGQRAGRDRVGEICFAGEDARNGYVSWEEAGDRYLMSSIPVQVRVPVYSTVVDVFVYGCVYSLYLAWQFVTSFLLDAASTQRRRPVTSQRSQGKPRATGAPERGVRHRARAGPWTSETHPEPGIPGWAQNNGRSISGKILAKRDENPENSPLAGP